MSKEDKLVEVYRSTSEMEAQVIKSLLESYEIPSLLQSNAAPSVHMFTVDGMGEVKIMVLSSMAASARELIKDKRHA
ncbi:putative signal transducing protein [Chloroflexota bacterium]